MQSYSHLFPNFFITDIQNISASSTFTVYITTLKATTVNLITLYGLMHSLCTFTGTSLVSLTKNSQDKTTTTKPFTCELESTDYNR